MLKCFVYSRDAASPLQNAHTYTYNTCASLNSNNTMAVAVDSDIDGDYEIKDVSEAMYCGA